MADTKYVYSFGNGKAEGRGDQKVLLGGKGAGLAEMTNIGLPVPAGFTITTEASAEYYRLGQRWPDELETQVDQALAQLEESCGRRFGDPDDPLLVSVRSGAAISMPGMMETILNLGINDRSVDGLARVSEDRRFALDAYRRLITMYGTTAAGIERARFDEAFDNLKNLRTRMRLGIPDHEQVTDVKCSEEELAELIDQFKTIYRDATGHDFPQDPKEQLAGAVNAVFGSWMAEKAVTYRRVEKISGLGGTAANVCQMVFGNLGQDSGTGVCFTRDPSTGENEMYGDLLMNAQGEDVVAGIRTPLKVAELAEFMPDIWEQLLAARAILELHYKEMQDLEFTVERGKLYLLQCRTGKRSPTAAFRIAVEQATQPLLKPSDADRLGEKGYLSKHYAELAAKPVIIREEAILRIKDRDIERLFMPIIDPDVSSDELARRRLGEGVSAVAGAAQGVVCFHPAEAERRAAEGEQVLLVRKETSPEDVGGMHAASGILTATGGKTSHAAVVARGWGKCCIVGCDQLRIDERAKTMSLNGRTFDEGQILTLDGTTGAIYEGNLRLVQPEAPWEYDTLLGWCDELRRLRVRTNADAPNDAARAIDFGAEGIGLCRTEHMFFDTQDRRLAIQSMIVADSSPARRAALDKLQPFQKQDFLDIFRVMDGKPVTIRLIDPPLHEFLPKNEQDIRVLADYAGISPEDVVNRTEQLHESNPMLGHRGCRLCLSYPEILEMQTSAIIEAATEAEREGISVLPEIMIPLTIDPKELRILADRVRATADAVLADASASIDYLVGTMIETPRAALLGDRIAEVSQFMSYGTNDLTQTTMALSRDDAGRFLTAYVDQEKHGIFEDDPFQSLDQEGVGMLVELGVKAARSIDPAHKIGVCGEHGGDPKSIKFFHRIGLDYVSCSPFRVPIARLAAAQAVIEEKQQAAEQAESTKGAPAKPKPKARVTGAVKKAARKTLKKAAAKVKKTARGKGRKKVAAKASRTTKKRATAKSTRKRTTKGAKSRATARSKKTAAKAKRKKTAKAKKTRKTTRVPKGRAKTAAKKKKTAPKKAARSKRKASKRTGRR
jgi:pyruvate,orthophosphate dikinase